MAITIYWSKLRISKELLDFNFLLSKPVPLIKNIPKEIKDSTYIKCPAFQHLAKNTFTLNFGTNYKISYQLNSDPPYVATDDYSQKYYEILVNDSIWQDNFFGMSSRFVFFSEQPVLLEQMHPYIHKNNIDGVHLNGSFDISNWFRPLDFTYYLNSPSGTININYEDIGCYIRFHTNEKIIFKEFNDSEKINDYVTRCTDLKASTQARNKVFGFNKIYNLFNENNMKKQIIKEIKNNLI